MLQKERSNAEEALGTLNCGICRFVQSIPILLFDCRHHTKVVINILCWGQRRYIVRGGISNLVYDAFNLLLYLLFFSFAYNWRV